MSEQSPSIGRIVHYKLTTQDAEHIMRRRTTSAHIAGVEPQWPAGVQAHIGNAVAAGDVFPMVIVKVWGPDAGSAVSGHVFLDGNDVFWATSRTVGEGNGQFSWPART